MADVEDEGRHMQVDTEERHASSSDSSDSEDDVSESREAPTKVEWLATGRERRSTAGNRMKSMIAAEEPDDELELLFAEDGEDAGFTDVEDDGSDAHMSSSEDEDAQENNDDLEGEKELEKQARESRQAMRKRKAQEAIPQKFRKKVKIDTSHTTSASATPTAPKPRPKKKSERMSWLPSPAEMPTRASRRETTIAGKEQLHKQMAEREIKRLKQLEAMERKAKRMEALKKPPMTQAERLAEAALVEKRNAKSLNRWEEAEKQREEERKAKLAALSTRTLEGPVVTFWSGVGEWIGGKLKHVGKLVTIEEKPTKKKRPPAMGHEGTPDTPSQAKPTDGNINTSLDKAVVHETNPSMSKDSDLKTGLLEKTPAPNTESPVTAPTALKIEAHSATSGFDQETPAMHDGAPGDAPVLPRASQAMSAGYVGAIAGTTNSQDQTVRPLGTGSQPQPLPPSDIRPPSLKPPDIQVPNPSLYTTSMFAPPQQSSLMKAPDLKPPPNSFLAPPVGVSQGGLSMPMLGYHNPSTSSVLAPPNPVQRRSPFSMPQTNMQPYSPVPLVPPSTTQSPNPAQGTPKPTTSTSTSTPPVTPSLSRNRPPKPSGGTSKLNRASAQKQQPKQVTPPTPPSPLPDGKATRNCIILQNFNENAIQNKSVQNRILFNREMHKLSKPGPVPRCVITNQPARYRDPKTGLPYHNAAAYKEIQKLYSGKYRWSSLVGAWVGGGSSAAVDVPARFLDPDAPGPPKVSPVSQSDSENNEATEDAETQEVKPNMSEEQPVRDPVLPTPKPSKSAAPSKTTSADDPPDAGPSTTYNPTVVGEPNISTQPYYVPTTEATFALNTDYTPFVASNNVTGHE
ncbi:YL1-domain-containing protein [Poronia punctata]|nr:YL1-domain-containing protein [Poronia punctata]